MFDYLKNILLPDESQLSEKDLSPVRSESHERKMQIATAALLVEMAKADGHFSEDEREKIIHTMQDKFNIDKEYVHELIELSEKKLEDSIGMYEFTSQINNHYSREEKKELLINLWKIIYVDERLDKYEDRLVKVVGGLLNLNHKEIINAKLLVKQELGK